MCTMKYSGIEWVGEIPSNWEVRRNKYNFTLNKTLVGNAYATTQLLSLTKNGVTAISENEQKGKVPTSFATYQIVDKDDLVMCLFDLDVSAVFAGVSPFNGMISPAYKCFKCNNDICPQYVDYYFRTVFVDRKYKRYSKNVRYSIGADEFMALPILVPPLEVQKSIANFLDQKCSEIDSLSADIQSQIDVLEEYKKSVITEAVTKGLNPDVEMKDSGIEWIGMIPAHWDVDKIKYHLKRNEPRNPGNVPVLSVYREYGVVPKNSRDDNHNVTSEDTSKYKYIRPGDLVINKMKAWQGSLAVSEYEGIVSPAYFVYNFTDELFNKKYFHFLIRSCYKDEFRRISGGIREGQWDLPAEGFANEFVLLPPIDEQNKIVEFIASKYTEIEEAIDFKKAQLETLAEYKKSLIYEYVTGKKEVAT